MSGPSGYSYAALSSTRVTTKMLSYYYYVEYLSRILDSYSYSTRCKYSFWQTYTPFLRDLFLLSFVSALFNETVSVSCSKSSWYASNLSYWQRHLQFSHWKFFPQYLCVHLSGVFSSQTQKRMRTTFVMFTQLGRFRQKINK